MRALDLTGQKFGYLVVTHKSKRVRSGSNSMIKWLCVCRCGKRFWVFVGSLRSGNTKSCGCAQWALSELRTLHRNACLNRKGTTPEQRFWAKVNIGTKNVCWPWRGRVNKDGYGWTTFYGKDRLSHCVAWELSRKRKIPAGKIVMHQCDCPPCCNPYHIHSGTHLKNKHDSMIKQRHAFGERNGQALFSNHQVHQFRKQFAKVLMSQAEFARRKGVHDSTISQILSGRSYRNA